jgi:hypothetical protein
MSPDELKRGYDWAYQEFYGWKNIFHASSAHDSFKHQLKHFSCSAGWKKFERAWDSVIRLKQLTQLRRVLEAVLSPVNDLKSNSPARISREDTERNPITVEAC